MPSGQNFTNPLPYNTEAKQIVTRLPLSLGSEHLDLAKEAFLRRGFSYVRREDGLYYWTQPEGTIGSEDVPTIGKRWGRMGPRIYI